MKYQIWLEEDGDSEELTMIKEGDCKKNAQIGSTAKVVHEIEAESFELASVAYAEYLESN